MNNLIFTYIFDNIYSINFNKIAGYVPPTHDPIRTCFLKDKKKKKTLT